MLNIIPRPNSEEIYRGDLTFDGGVAVSACDEARPAEQMVRNMLSKFCPTIRFSDSGKVAIKFEKDALLPKESYRIDADGDKLIMTASGMPGWTYALVSLRQMLRTDRDDKPMYASCPCCHIDDSPRFAYRGVMLDEARHFFGETEVKRLLDLMCLYKLNVLHWHLSDDQGYRVESDVFPLLTTVASRRNDTQVGGKRSDKFTGIASSGYYTKKQIRHIVEYARERNIEIVPELDMPSHCTAILAAYPDLSCHGEKTDVSTTFGNTERSVCPGKESTYDFAAKLVDEWCELFPSPLFHIGADEPAEQEWKTCSDCREAVVRNGLGDIKELLPLFVNRIADLLRERGKTPVIWSEKLLRGVRKHAIFEVFDHIDPKALATEVSQGRRVIVATADRYYASRPYCMTPLKKTYCYEPTSVLGSPGSDAGVIGVEMPLWSEWVYDRLKLDFNLFPRMCAMAESAWTDRARKSLSDFRKRWDAHKALMDSIGVAYAGDKLTDPGIFTRKKSEYIWKNVDQYDEVRRNNL